MSSRRSPDLYARIGGDALRAVIVDFYQRVFADVMIGFLFVGKDPQRLIDKEWEFTAHFLGADVEYTGRPMRQAHAASPIFGGHFERRLQILRQTLAAHGVDDEVARAWIEHQQLLRPQITVDRGSECKDSGVPATFGEGTAAAGEGPAAAAVPPIGAAAVASEVADKVATQVARPAVEGFVVCLGRKPGRG
jgi:hemoglobin